MKMFNGLGSAWMFDMDEDDDDERQQSLSSTPLAGGFKIVRLSRR